MNFEIYFTPHSYNQSLNCRYGVFILEYKNARWARIKGLENMPHDQVIAQIEQCQETMITQEVNDYIKRHGCPRTNQQYNIGDMVIYTNSYGCRFRLMVAGYSEEAYYLNTNAYWCEYVAAELEKADPDLQGV